MYKSCNLILHGLCFYPDMIVSCCYAPNDKINNGLPPVLFPNYKGEVIPKDKLFAKIKEYSSKFNQGGCPEECKGCFQIQEKDWDESEYIDFITITNYTRCNADCVYCSNSMEPDERKEANYKVLPFLRYLKQEGILRKGMEIHLGGGEISIYEECEDLLSEFGLDNFAKICVATNAIKFSEYLDKSLKESNTYVIVSLDSGTRKTFKKVKRIDAFDKVVENICKYNTGTKPDRIALKYIIIPGINDNIKEFQSFLNIAKKANVNHIRIDIEARYLRSVNNSVNPYYLKIAEKMNSMAIKQGFSCELYSFFQQSFSKISYKDKFKNIVDFIQLKYLKKGIKKYYTNHKY